MKLIVGLGNPGKEYENTRHNVGFMVLDYYAKEKNIDFKNKFNGLYSEFVSNNDKIILLKPQSFMNNSGDVVKKFVDYYKISIENIIVVYDDVDFDVGFFKVKSTGTSGGHNGINDVIKKLGTNNINRIRIGVGKNQINLVNYVLGKFSNEENSKLEKIFPTISKILNDFEHFSIEKIMSIYNKKEKNEE